MSAENISIILGMKVRQFRQKAGYSLKTLAGRCGLSPSYLNEIEKGKKYPKADKLYALAKGLEVEFDDLVSLKLDRELNPFASVLEAPLIRKFPYHLFGLNAQDLIDIMANHPKEMGTLVRVLAEFGRTYDMRVEHFFYTALRTYQILNRNYFDDLEIAVGKFREQVGWRPELCPEFEDVWKLLQERCGYTAYETAPDKPLDHFRSVFMPKEKQLFLNPKLTDPQRAFVAARELAYHEMKIDSERAFSSPTLEVGNFEQVLNNFKASYFADALLIPEKRLIRDLKGLFREATWRPERFMNLFNVYHVTPEMLFYRLSELLPRHFKTQKIHFLKFSRRRRSESQPNPSVHLTKHLNMSRVHIPHGLSLKEHFCRRWLSVSIIDDLEKSGSDKPIIDAQLSEFINSDSTFFCIAVASANAMEDTLSSVTIGFQVDEVLKKSVRFWNDPAIQQRKLGQTCERCPLDRSECDDRVAPPTIYEESELREKRKRDLAELMEGGET